jgi:hypothetical protein
MKQRSEFARELQREQPSVMVLLPANISASEATAVVRCGTGPCRYVLHFTISAQAALAISSPAPFVARSGTFTRASAQLELHQASLPATGEVTIEGELLPLPPTGALISGIRLRHVLLSSFDLDSSQVPANFRIQGADSVGVPVQAWLEDSPTWRPLQWRDAALLEGQPDSRDHVHGPFLAAGAVDARFALRAGYEFAQTEWLAYFLTAETDFTRLTLVPGIEGIAPTLSDLMCITPSVAVGAGLPIDLLGPEPAFGAHGQLTLQFPIAGLVLSADWFPSRRTVRLGIMGRVSL